MLVVELKNNLSVRELGGKGYSLGILIKNNFDVPKGFVIISEAFFKFLKYNGITEKIEKLTSEICKNNFQEKTKEIRNLILEGEMLEDLISETKNYLNKLDIQYVSVRSSAISEDSLKASFAGLHDTFLNVKTDLDIVLENVKKCWASLFNERVVVYRIKKEIPHLEGMAVVVQEMIPADVSGITFTIHPSNEKTLLIEASYGLGDMIVSGKIVPDAYVFDRGRQEIAKKRVGYKDKMIISQGKEIKIVDIEKELTQKQVISDEQIKEIAKICLKAEKIFNYPQDIEWCIFNNKLYLLQSRAITR